MWLLWFLVCYGAMGLRLTCLVVWFADLSGVIFDFRWFVAVAVGFAFD